MNNVFYVNLLDLEDRYKKIENDILKLGESYKKFQDFNLELEVEHFNSLQDFAILETQLYKYQSECKAYEDARNSARAELKKLAHQNQYYEHIIDCFKHEMTVMSEQLSNLQDILKLSNQSCKEENSQLYNAILGLQKLSDKLQGQLIKTEKKALVETQKNQIKDAKIDELQLIIGQKNADLNVHDEAINEMRMKLEATLLENHELKGTIASLNSTVMQLQCSMQDNDIERSRRPHKEKNVCFKRSVSDCRDGSDRKNRRLEYLDSAVKSVERELEIAKEKSKEKIRNLKRQNEELKDKLATSDLTTQRIREQMIQLKEQLIRLSQKECCREQELSQSKQIIIDLRQTLIEVNESLAEHELHYLIVTADYQNNKDSPQEDLYLNARSEIGVYKKLVDNLKDEILGARKKVADLQARNSALKEELKNNENKIGDIQKRAAKNEHDSCQCIEELTQKLKESQAEEKRLTDFINNLKQDVQRKIEEKQEAQRAAINICECNTMISTQEEISTLKIEIKNMIENQLALNTENDRLLKQVNSLHCNISQLEEKNRNMKLKLEKIRADNQCLKEKNKLLQCEKDTCVQTVKSLEAELAETKNNRDDLCIESRHVVNNVKAWLEEQKKINDKVMKKSQCYCETIAKLKQENEILLASRPLATSTPYRARNVKPCTPVDCINMWYAGSQGSSGSPRDSPVSCTCSIEEWYSPTFKDEDETEENDEHFIQTVEAITREMKYNNRKWKNKCQECVVTKDNK